MSRPRMLRSAPALALLLLSCVGDSPTAVRPDPDPNAPPAAIVATSGVGQAGTAEVALGGPLVVKVTDARGKGLHGIEVSWTVSPGGGALSAASSRTDSIGEARTLWTLGAAGTHTVTASVSGLPPVTFSATAAPPKPARIERVAGDGQTGEAGAALADSLAVKVVSAAGTPVGGVAVEWKVTAGGGTLAGSASTDAQGVAKARWALGGAGEN
ncbi:MAG TPA: Ig-like domain-containing protein, partial [Longimicrobiaceae bacterium]|nr:Ig-like domain-containing protein [Longimicrobiaceae bacterium]